MKTLLKQAKIIDPTSKFHKKKKDVLIIDGVIKEISSDIENNDKDLLIISSDDLHVSQGWVDLKAHFCDPGEEHKETLASGLDSAAAGGFTHVAVLPSTNPVIDHKSLVEYLLKKSEKHAVSVLPIACMTKKMEGKELSEMFVLRSAGAIMFSDDTKTPQAQILMNALLYSTDFNTSISVSLGNDVLSKQAQVNEGMASLKTGLKANAEISEIIEIEKNIRMIEYAGGQLHLSGVSTKEGAELIKEAKKKGMKITSDVHLMNLCFNEERVIDFDTAFKTLPVLRNQKNVDSLWKALKDGSIDFVVSDHRPAIKEEKELEFEHASFGSPQLRTLYSALNSKNKISTEKLVQILAEKPRNFVGLPKSTIETGKKADLTIFDPKVKFDMDSIKRKEELIYSPFKNESNLGKVIGIIHNNQFVGNH